MITYRRPLKASDIYDVGISTKPQIRQNVFWSIGYKSSEMRKIHKPNKNDGPMEINFGRRPRWNCPRDEHENENEEEIPLDFQISASQKMNSNNPSERRLLPGLRSQTLPVSKIPRSEDATLSPPRKIPRSRTGPNPGIDNWSDIFSPPTFFEYYDWFLILSFRFSFLRSIFFAISGWSLKQ